MLFYVICPEIQHAAINQCTTRREGSGWGGGSGVEGEGERCGEGGWKWNARDWQSVCVRERNKQMKETKEFDCPKQK